MSKSWHGMMVKSYLLVATALLAACGSGGTAASASSTSGSTTAQTRPSGPRGGGLRPVSGTVDAYDAATKVLTVKQANGSTQTFSVGSARILKSQKITQQQLSALLGTSGTTVLVMGQQGSSGTYTAQTLLVSDATSTAFAGNGPRGAFPNGTPGVRPSGTPGVRPNGTPRAGSGGRLLLHDGKLQNNQLVGTDQAGKTVTVDLSSSTTLMQQLSGTVSDLKVGLAVTITAGPKQGSSTTTARSIVIGNIAQLATNQ